MFRVKKDLHPAIRILTYLIIFCTTLSGSVTAIAAQGENTNQYQSSSTDSSTQSGLDDQQFDDDLLDLDIEQLQNVDVVVPSFDIEVSSVTRSKSTIGKSPAAVFVITQEMIRRSTATCVPELLRMVPGIQVARIDANKWTISSRGFNGFIANRTLIMIDGRKIATPLFEGIVFGSINWDAQELVLEDIERIEVVRGPGGTMWGANAVNGVINIVTKSSKDTQGFLYSGGGGSEDKAINSLRQGEKIGNDLYYRVYAKQTERGTFENRDTFGRHGDVYESGANDDSRLLKFGFRSDWEVDGDKDNVVTVQGDYYQGASGFSAKFTDPVTPHEDFPIYDDFDISGGNLLARWTRTFDEDTSSTVQMYYDHLCRDSQILDSQIDIFDFEITNRCRPFDDHKLTWGGRFRSYNDNLDFQNDVYLYGSDKQTRNLGSVFLQDEINLIDDVLSLWLGAKVEHNDYTGIEVHPSARFLWSLDEKQVIWGAVSRAVRTPSRAEDDLRLNIGIHNHLGITGLAQYNGSRDLDSENVISYELGYRAQPTDYFSWDIATFYNEYSDLIAFTGQTAAFIPPSTSLLIDVFDNNMRGNAYGAEISGTIQFTEWWRLMASYSILTINLDLDPGVDATQVYEEGASPHNQVYAQMSWDLPCDLEFDIAGRYVDKLPADDDLRGYFQMNTRLGYRPNENWEFAVIGQNLLMPSHQEFQQLLVAANRVQRGIFAQVIFRR